MNYQIIEVNKMTSEPEIISRILERFVAELRERGVTDHLWVLYALDSIADYCRENALDDAGIAIENVIQIIDSDVIQSSKAGSKVH